MKKYEIIDENTRLFGIFGHRIRALKDFSDVKAGDIGGFVSSEDNLSHEGDCWIYDNAMALQNSRVDQNAKLKNYSRAYDNAVISGNAELHNYAEAYKNCYVFDDVKMFGHSKVFDNAELFGDCILKDYAVACKVAWVSSGVILEGKSWVSEKTTKTPINLSGYKYNITIMDKYMSFDCETRTPLEWYEMSDRELIEINGPDAVRFHKRFKKILMSVAIDHQELDVNLNS